MSAVGDFLFGESPTPATVQDITPTPFANLQGLVGGQLGNILTQSGIDANMPTVAGLTPQEQQLLGLVQNQAASTSPQMSAAGDQLLRQIQGGGISPLLREGNAGNTALRTLLEGGTGATSPLMQQGGNAGSLMQNILSGRTMDPASNPALQASIEAAQRPIMEQFGDDLIGLRSQFTRAGQFVQPESSSPFDVADARLRSGVAGALGDVSTRLVAENMNQERARQMQALGLTENAFQTGQNRSLQGMVQGLGLGEQAYQAGEDRALQAARSAPAFDLSQLEGTMSALEAQALPRLIEQRGLDRGLDEFNNQMQRFLQALNISGQVSQPTNVTLPGSPGSDGFMGPILAAAGTAIGGPVGGAIGSSVGGMFNRGNDNPGPAQVGGTVNTSSLNNANAWGPVFR